ncbi:DUF748 domain-containing protein [Salinisphaera sp. S4-8]|uniref:DUF748 domain-containing protein n=1 Tax=Salinisphaera sp. S4-8 TaxID=633357 RepID=UPI00334188A8
MKFSRRTKGALVALCVFAVLLAAAALWLPSIVVRGLTLHYLEQAGMQATIGDVDVNIVTGTVVYDDIQASAAEGEQIAIGRLALSLAYAPLLSKRVVLEHLAIENGAFDIHRDRDNTLRVGGYPIGTSDSQATSLNWGIALQHVVLRGLRVHYSQPANGQQRAIDRELVLNDSNARDVVSWQQNNDVPMDADVSVGDSRIRLSGRVTPFGDRISGHFELVTERFALELIAPLASAGGLRELTGLVDSDQQIDFEYDSASALAVSMDGKAHGHQSVLALNNGPRLRSGGLSWQGKIDMQLFRAQGQPATITSNGAIDVDGFTLDNGHSFQLEQPKAHWQGKTTLTLAKATQLALDGAYRADKPALKSGATALRTAGLDWKGTLDSAFAPNTSELKLSGRIDAEKPTLVSAGTTVKSPRLSWQGPIDTRLAQSTHIHGDGRLDSGALTIDSDSLHADTAAVNWQGKITFAGLDDIDTDGRLKSDRLALASPGALDMVLAKLDWQGAIDIDTGAATRIQSDGKLDATRLTFDVPESALFEANDVSWRGSTVFDIATLFARRARGRVIGNDARLELPGQPLALTTDRIVFNGAYSEQPARGALRLAMDGDMASQNFRAQNTALDAPWLALRDTEVHRLVIDGIDDIAFDSLSSKGVRVLGDTDTSAAVLQAVSTTVRGFRLSDLAYYQVGNMDIDGANIHVRRDANGMGVMAQYFAGPDDDAADNATTDAEPGPGTRYAIDHLSLTGSQIVFNDVAVTPNVSLRGSELEFNLDGLDTGHPDQDASYRLALDVGEYGHLDSRGKIAPLATGGLEMDIDAWLRSLALTPLSGYLNAAMGRRIANGVADGTLNLSATNGQLDGILDTTLSNFRLIETPGEETEIVLGISMDTALALVRGQSDTIHFQTAILGDVTNPYFSIRNLVREAVLAGLRTAIMSDYSPVGLLNKAKNALLSIGRSLVSQPVVFVPNRDYIRPDDRPYLGKIAQKMTEKPGLRLTIQGHATPADAKAMSLFGSATIDSDNEDALHALARRRGKAVRDYLAARDVLPQRFTLADPVIDRDEDAQPRATLSLSAK